MHIDLDSEQHEVDVILMQIRERCLSAELKETNMLHTQANHAFSNKQCSNR